MRKLLFIFLLPVALISIWYRANLFIGTGESALPFYNVSHTITTLQTPWNDGALGYPNGINASLGLYFFIWKLSNIFPNFLIQYIVFFVLLLVPLIGLVLLAKKLNLSKISIYISILFYTFNLASMVIVWGRMQYPFIFFYAGFPLVYFVFLAGIEKFKVINIFFINFILFIFSIIFTSLPMIELFWFLLLIHTIFYTLIHLKERKKVLLCWAYFLITFMSWLLLSTWWLLPYLKTLTTTDYITNQAYSNSGDTKELISLSERLGNLSYVFRLIHKDYFSNMQAIWGNIYSSSLFIVITYCIPFVTFFPLLMREKNKYLYFFLGSSLLFLFLIKGSREPFGFIFLFFFSHFRFLEAFRNPFEKFILALPFFYAPLVSYSVYIIYKYIDKKRNILAKFLLVLGSVLMFGIIVFPMWNRWVFSSNIPPASNLKIGDYVIVPIYYEQANSWLKRDNSDFRSIALPIGGEGITYKWEYGYSGVELSNSLFDKPFISISTTIQFLDTITSQLEYTFVKYPQYISQVMSLLNSKYLMIRSDVDYKGREMRNPQYFLNNVSGTNLEKYSNVSFVKSFGKLSFYKNLLSIAKVYAVTGGYYVPASLPFVDLLSQTDFSRNDALLNSTSIPTTNDLLMSKSKEAFYSPTNFIDSNSISSLTLDEAEKNIPYTRFSPGSFLFPIIKTLETLSLMGGQDSGQKLLTYIDLTEKRLGDLQKGIDIQNPRISLAAVYEYNNLVSELIQFINSGHQSKFISSKDYLGRKLLLEKVLLDNLKDKINDRQVNAEIAQSNRLLSGLLATYHVIPQHTPLISNAKWVMYQFTVPQNGIYELEVHNEDINKYYNWNSSDIQLNDNRLDSQQNLSEDWIQLGSYTLRKGVNEVFFYTSSEKNLISNSDSNTNVLSTGKVQQVDFPINNFDAYSSYTIHVEYKISGNGCFLVEVKTDIGESFRENQGCRSTLHGWQVRNINYAPNTAPTKASLQLKLQNFDGKTSIEYKNIQITRNFTNKLLLKRTLNNSISTSVPTVNFDRINASKYIVHIHNAQQPFFLIFSESFHPLWKASFADGKQVDENNHILVNSYANAWYIEKKGSYTLTLEFIAEEYYLLGIKITLIGGILATLGIVGFSIYNKKRKHV